MHLIGVLLLENIMTAYHDHHTEDDQDQPLIFFLSSLKKYSTAEQGSNDKNIFMACSITKKKLPNKLAAPAIANTSHACPHYYSH